MEKTQKYLAVASALGQVTDIQDNYGIVIVDEDDRIVVAAHPRYGNDDGDTVPFLAIEEAICMLSHLSARKLVMYMADMEGNPPDLNQEEKDALLRYGVDELIVKDGATVREEPLAAPNPVLAERQFGFLHRLTGAQAMLEPDQDIELSAFFTELAQLTMLATIPMKALDQRYPELYKSGKLWDITRKLGVGVSGGCDAQGKNPNYTFFLMSSGN